MTDDKRGPTIGVIGTGAENVRMLAGLAPRTAPRPPLDEVAMEPAITGAHGRGWACDLEEGRRLLADRANDDATVAMWVIEARYAHPVWHSYLLVLVHLRPMADLRETVFYLQGATHELMYLLGHDFVCEGEDA